MSNSAGPGDYVKLQLTKREIEGTLLKSHENDVYLIKLRSGYNVGVKKENVLDLRVIRKFKDERKDFKIPSRKGKPCIGLVVTGGTIASRLDSRTGGVSALTDIKEFAKFYPKLFEKYYVKTLEVPFMCLSENMNSDDWKKIAGVVLNMLNDKEIEGVIVTHGSDFLHYTSAALSYFLRNLNKPVVLTFSQRSIDRASSDAELNLECAGLMAISDCAEVVIVGHGSMNDDYCFAHIGTKVRKMHTSRRDTFESINAKALAKISLKNGVEFLSMRRPRNSDKVELDDVFNKKVVLVKFYPGQSSDVLDYFLDNGVKGIVIEASGLGHMPSSEVKHSWIPIIKKLVKKGVLICATAQTIKGRLNPKVYSTGRELENAGVLFLEDMLSETAFVKLGWILGHNKWKTLEKVKEKMRENIAREYNELLSE